MWIIQEPNKLALWNKLHFEEKKNGEYRACLKYSVPISVEEIYKMQRSEVSGAVRPIYRSLGVKRLKQNTRDNEGLSSRRNKGPSTTCRLNAETDKKTRHLNHTLHSRHCTALGPENKDKHGNVWVSMRHKIISGMEYVPWQRKYIQLIYAFFLECRTLEDGSSILSRNISGQLPNYAAQHPRRAKTLP